MGEKYTVSSKEGSGFIKFEETRTMLKIEVIFSEHFRSGLVSPRDRQDLVRMLNEMEVIFLDYTERLA